MTKEKSELFLKFINKPVQMEVPFLYDMNKRTALDITLATDLSGRESIWRGLMHP